MWGSPKPVEPRYGSTVYCTDGSWAPEPKGSLTKRKYPSRCRESDVTSAQEHKDVHPPLPKEAAPRSRHHGERRHSSLTPTEISWAWVPALLVGSQGEGMILFPSLSLGKHFKIAG